MSGAGGPGLGAPGGQLQRLLRGPPLGRPRDGRGRARRRADGRLAGRADDVHPAQDPGAQRRLRPHVPPRARRGPPDLRRTGDHRGRPTPAACIPRRWRPRCGSWRGARACRCGSPRSRVTTSRRGSPSCGRRASAFVNLDTGEPLPAEAAVVTANAYLRPARSRTRWPPVRRWSSRAGSPTPPSSSGPALHAFGWADGEHDAIAGAVVAGHVIECGAQCCGGNYAFFDEVPGRERIGFPLAEVHPDGSSVITKHPGTGGAVTVGTVTAQLLYEIGGPALSEPRRGGPVRHHRALAGRARPGAHRRASAASRRRPR